jgi:hypothetical protein
MSIHGPEYGRLHELQSGVKVKVFPTPPKTLNLARASESELEHYGLPTRKILQTMPRLYNVWQRSSLDHAHSFVTPEFEPMPRLRRQLLKPSTVNDTLTSIWSGVVTPAPSLDLITGGVSGQFIIPSVQNVGGSENHCSIWVGIDGDGVLDPRLAKNLVQAGVEATVDGSGTTSYYAWFEWLSDVPVPETKIGNFPVNPGENFVCQIWLTSPSTANIYMFAEKATLFAITAPPDLRVVGGCAEWIVERPSFLYPGGLIVPSDLPQYGSVEFADAMAWTGAHDTLFPGSGSGRVYDMTDDSGNIISTAKIISKEILACTRV